MRPVRPGHPVGSSRVTVQCSVEAAIPGQRLELVAEGELVGGPGAVDHGERRGVRLFELIEDHRADRRDAGAAGRQQQRHRPASGGTPKLPNGPSIAIAAPVSADGSPSRLAERALGPDQQLDRPARAG